MREKKYTQKKWLMCRDGSGYFICNEKPQESIHNYNLIAAAPELLEELQYLRRFVNPDRVDCGPADAAIAKAYGE